MSVAGSILVGMEGQSTPDKLRLEGLVTTTDLRAAGITRRQQATLLGRGELVAVSSGVLARGSVYRELVAKSASAELLRAAAALVTSAPGAVASHHTAAVMYNLDLLGWPPQRISITRPPASGSRSGKPGVLVHSAELPPGHVTRRKGVPVTTVARTVIDIARISPFRAGVVTADSALRRAPITRDDLVAVLNDCRQWRGARTAAAVVDFADGLAESALESIARVLFRDLGLPPPELQAWIGDGHEEVRVDFRWRQYRTIAEVDGAVKYTDLTADPAMRAIGQLRRDEFLRELGYEVVHFTWQDITRDQHRVAAAIRTAFRRGSRSPHLATVTVRAGEEEPPK
jgi:very-short-patch-repair endonuclease